MGLKKNNPGCNCCDSCTEYTDDFATDPYASPERWTAVSGSWSGGSGALTPSGAGLTVFNQAMPSSMMAMRMSWDGFANGDVARFIICYQDSSNYLYGRVTIGATTAVMAVFKVQGGVTSTVATGNSVSRGSDTLGTASVCYNPTSGRLSGNFSINNNLSAAEGLASASTLGNQAGVEVASSISGNFEGFFLGGNTGDCAYCVGICNLCEDNLMPISIQVEVDGIDANTCNSSDCVPMNGTYVLSRSGPCNWELILGGSGTCGLYGVFADIINPSPNTYVLRVKLSDETLLSYFLARQISYNPSKPGCLGWDSLELTTDDGSNSRCDLTGATMRVTAL